MKLADRLLKINEKDLGKDLDSIQKDFIATDKKFQAALNDFAKILDDLIKLKENYSDNGDKESVKKLDIIIKSIKGNSYYAISSALTRYDMRYVLKELRDSQGIK